MFHLEVELGEDQGKDCKLPVDGHNSHRSLWPDGCIYIVQTNGGFLPNMRVPQNHGLQYEILKWSNLDDVGVSLF